MIISQQNKSLYEFRLGLKVWCQFSTFSVSLSLPCYIAFQVFKTVSDLQIVLMHIIDQRISRIFANNQEIVTHPWQFIGCIIYFLIGIHKSISFVKQTTIENIFLLFPVRYILFRFPLYSNEFNTENVTICLLYLFIETVLKNVEKSEPLKINALCFFQVNLHIRQYILDDIFFIIDMCLEMFQHSNADLVEMYLILQSIILTVRTINLCNAFCRSINYSK